MSNPDRPDRSNRPTTGTGAAPLGEDRRKRRPWWLLILLAAIIIVALILLLSRCGGDDNTASNAAGSATSAAGSAASSVTGSPSDNADVSTPAATSPAATSPAASTPAVSTPAATPPAAGSGTLTVNGTSLLPIATAAGAGGDLSKYTGQAAVAKDVMVLSAPADNGFWVGTSTTDQVYVHLLQPGLVSPHPVQAGDHISFTGKVVANSATLAADDGVTDAEGAAQLTAQKAHIEIAKSSVVFTS